MRILGNHTNGERIKAETKTPQGDREDKITRAKRNAMDMYCLLHEVIAPLGATGYHPSLGFPATQRIREILAKIDGE
jgi:hypothetical protein